MYIIKKNWDDRKPIVGSAINWSHPLSDGLAGCWLFNEGSGYTKNLCYPFNLVTHSWFNGIPKFCWTDKIYGKSIIGFGSFGLQSINNGLYGVARVGTPLDYPFISVGIIVRPTVTSTGMNFISRYHNGDGKRIFQLGSSSTIASRFAARFYIAGAVQTVEDSEDYNINKFYHLCVTYDGLTLKLFKNGIKVSSTDIAGTLTAYSTLNLKWGRDSQDTGQSSMQLTNSYLYGRSLTENEVKILYESPYCFIQPITRRFYPVPTSAPPVTGEVSYGYMTTNTKYW